MGRVFLCEDPTDERFSLARTLCSYFSSNNRTTWSAESNQGNGVYNHTLHVTKANTDYASLIFNGMPVSQSFCKCAIESHYSYHLISLQVPLSH